MNQTQPEKLEIFYVRHADTVGGSVQGRHQCDIDITPLGEKQIALLSDRFAGRSFDAVLCSPTIRCIKTASGLIARNAVHPKIEIVPELIEIGTHDGFVPDLNEIRSIAPGAFFCPDTIYRNRLRDYGSLLYEENVERANALITYFRSRFSFGQKIAVVSHGHFARFFLSAAVGFEMSEDYIFSMNNTGVSKIKYTSDGMKRLSFHNDFSHLREIMPDYEFTV